MSELSVLERMQGAASTPPDTPQSGVLSRMQSGGASGLFPPENTIMNRLSAGIDDIQATGGGFVEALGDLTGVEEMQKYGEEVRLRNIQESGATVPPIEDIWTWGGIGDALVQSSPYLAAMAASTGTGAAIGTTILPGVGTGLGAALGLGLSAFGLNLGDIKILEEQLDPDSEAGLDTLGLAGVATGFDMLTGGFIGNAGKQAIKQSAKQRLKSVAVNTGVGAVSGLGSTATVLGAPFLTTDAEMDEEKADAYAENVAVGTILNATGAGVTTPLSQTAFRAKDAGEQTQDAVSVIKFDEEGSPYYHSANPLVMDRSDALTTMAGRLNVGRAVDQVVARAPENAGFRDLGLDFDMNLNEKRRNVGRDTINIEAQKAKGDIMEALDQFELNKLNRKQQDAIKADYVAGKDGPFTQKIKNSMDMVYKMAIDAGIKMGKINENYFPFHPDIKRIKKDRDLWEKEMVDALKDKGVKANEAQQRVKIYTDELLGEGGLKLGDQARMPNWLADTLELAAYKADGIALTPAQEKRLRSPVKLPDDRGNINSYNNLEMHRALSEVPQEKLNKWSRQDLSLLQEIEQYVQQATERIAYANRMGPQNEKLNERIRLSAVEGMNKGQPLPSEAVKKMYELADLQQRITASKTSPKERQITAGVKTAMNWAVLQKALLPSLLEPIFLGAKTGPTSFAKGMVKSFDNLGRKLARKGGLKSLPRGEAEEVVASLNSSYHEALTTTAARMGDDTFDPTKADSVLFAMNGLAAWTEFTRQWALLSAIDSFERLTKKSFDTRLSKGARRDAGETLAESGLDVTKMGEWIADGSRKEHPYYGDIRSAAIGLAEDVVFRPKPANKPMWSSSQKWYAQLFSHLKTFPLQFNNRVFLPVMGKLVNQGGATGRNIGKTLVTMVVATAGSYLVNMLKSIVATGDTDRWEEKTTSQKLVSTLAQVGSAGLLVDPVNAPNFGGTAAEAVLGPTASKASSIVGTAGQVALGGATPEALVREVVNASPVPDIAGVRDVVIEALGD